MRDNKKQQKKAVTSEEGERDKVKQTNKANVVDLNKMKLVKGKCYNILAKTSYDCYFRFSWKRKGKGIQCYDLIY